jgi:dTDP-4-dehydrorhamnose 3,5-epimerase-like enzyme
MKNTENSDSNIIKFDIKGDERGLLVAYESARNIPFEIKRVFCIYHTKEGVARGQHSHYKTKQLLVAIHGSCKVSLDNGKEKKTYLLDNPDKGLLQKELIWGEMFDFSQDCVLMVFADDYYRNEDYIRNYDDFIRLVK